MQYDTIVVGMGVAGVRAASTLAEGGRRVLGLEAQERIGGRVNTVPFGDRVVELGAEWIHGSDGSTVYDTAVKNNVTLLSQDLTMDVYHSDGSKGDSELLNDLINFSLASIEDAVNETVPLGVFLTKKTTRPELLNDEDFMEGFLDLMDLLVDNLTASDSWNNVSSHTEHEALEGEQHLSWHRHGYKTYFDLMLNTYQGGPGYPNLDIKLNTEVTKIIWPQQPSELVQVICADGQTYKANNVIVTVSLGVLKERHANLFSPPLPEAKSKAIKDLAMGVMDKIVLSFEKAWWPNLRTFFGFLWNTEDKKKVPKEDYWTTRILGASSPMGSSNTLTLWTSGETGKLVETLPEDVVKRKSVELLQKFLGVNITVPEPTGILRTTWYSNPFTRGSYTFDSVESMKYPNSREELGKPLLDSAGKPRVLLQERINTHKNAMQYDTIVVGMGVAGVRAASTLAEGGRRVLGLEAQERIGGRVNTVPFGDGVVELGAEWIHGSDGSTVYDTAVKNNVTLLSQDLTMDVYHSDGSKSDSELLNELINFSLASIEDAVNETVPLGVFLIKKVKEYIRTTRPELLKDEDFMEGFLDLMDLIVDNLTASDSWNNVSSQTEHEALEGEQHLSWHRHGYKTYFDLMLNTYQGGPGYPNLDIKLNTEVTKIIWPQQPSELVQVICADGQTYKANNVIVTVSLGVLKERHANLFSPSLPEAKSKAIKDLTMGVMDKIVLSFEKAWWPNLRTFFGFLWNREDKKKVPKEDYWTTRILGASSPMGSSNTLTLWTSGETGKLVETLPEDVVKRKSVELLQKFLGANVTVPEPTGILRTTWYSNPFTRGSYTFDSVESMKYPNSREELGKPLLDSAGTPRVLFAGEGTSLTHFSTVHGASETGYREAMRLLQ